MIYVPDLSYECYVVQNESTIRAYEEKPYTPSNYNDQVTIGYRDYYYNSNYLYQDGYQQFSRYSTIPVCLDKKNLTTDFYYRNDFDSILIILFIFLFLTYFVVKKIIRVFFLGFRWS